MNLPPLERCVRSITPSLMNISSPLLPSLPLLFLLFLPSSNLLLKNPNRNYWKKKKSPLPLLLLLLFLLAPLQMAIPLNLVSLRSKYLLSRRHHPRGPLPSLIHPQNLNQAPLFRNVPALPKRADLPRRKRNLRLQVKPLKKQKSQKRMNYQIPNPPNLLPAANLLPNRSLSPNHSLKDLIKVKEVIAMVPRIPISPPQGHQQLHRNQHPKEPRKSQAAVLVPTKLKRIWK